MTTHCPPNIYREDVLRREWWLHVILVVVLGLDLGLFCYRTSSEVFPGSFCSWRGGGAAFQGRPFDNQPNNAVQIRRRRTRDKQKRKLPSLLL